MSNEVVATLTIVIDKLPAVQINDVIWWEVKEGFLIVQTAKEVFGFGREQLDFFWVSELDDDETSSLSVRAKDGDS